AVASTTPDPCDAVMRQAPILNLASDEETEGFLVHRGLAGSGSREHTPNSPGSRPRQHQPLRPGCRHADSSTNDRTQIGTRRWDPRQRAAGRAVKAPKTS